MPAWNFIHLYTLYVRWRFDWLLSLCLTDVIWLLSLCLTDVVWLLSLCLMDVIFCTLMPLFGWQKGQLLRQQFPNLTLGDQPNREWLCKNDWFNKTMCVCVCLTDYIQVEWWRFPPAVTKSVYKWGGALSTGRNNCRPGEQLLSLGCCVHLMTDSWWCFGSSSIMCYYVITVVFYCCVFIVIVIILL